MSYLAERISIENFFNTNYTPPAGVDLFFENIPIPEQNNDPYIVLLVRDGTAFQGSMGGSVNNLFRNNGFAICEIRHLIDTGTNAALTIADDIANVFRAQQFDGITMLAPTIDRIGDRNGWYQVNVLTNFRRDVFQ